MAIDRSKSIQSSLWPIAQESARQNPTAITALFVSSLNEVIDLSEKRLTALENRIPPTIWLMLLPIAFLTCFTFWLRTTPKILAGGCRHPAHDRHRHGINRRPGQSAQRLPSCRSAQP
jgi:hypothetical protein